MMRQGDHALEHAPRSSAATAPRSLLGSQACARSNRCDDSPGTPHTYWATQGAPNERPTQLQVSGNVTVASNDSLLETPKSNLKEVQPRGGERDVRADADSHFPETDQIQVLSQPEHCDDLSPILHVAPLQLLAYHTVVAKRTGVDKPINLAKSAIIE